MGGTPLRKQVLLGRGVCIYEAGRLAHLTVNVQAHIRGDEQPDLVPQQIIIPVYCLVYVVEQSSAGAGIIPCNPP